MYVYFIFGSNSWQYLRQQLRQRRRSGSCRCSTPATRAGVSCGGGRSQVSCRAGRRRGRRAAPVQACFTGSERTTPPRACCSGPTRGRWTPLRSCWAGPPSSCNAVGLASALIERCSPARSGGRPRPLRARRAAPRRGGWAGPLWDCRAGPARSRWAGSPLDCCSPPGRGCWAVPLQECWAGPGRGRCTATLRAG